MQMYSKQDRSEDTKKLIEAFNITP